MEKKKSQKHNVKKEVLSGIFNSKSIIISNFYNNTNEVIQLKMCLIKLLFFSY